MVGRTAEAMAAATGAWEGHRQERWKREGQKWRKGEGHGQKTSLATFVDCETVPQVGVFF